MMKSMGLLLVSAVVLGVGVKIGADAYEWVKFKLIEARANHLLAYEEAESIPVVTSEVAR